MIALLSKNVKMARTELDARGVEVLRMQEATLRGVMRVAGNMEVEFKIVVDPDQMRGVWFDGFDVLGRCDPFLIEMAKTRVRAL